jgi:hypothetical protein
MIQFTPDREVEFHEDAGNVLLDGARRDDQYLSDRGIGASFSR